MILRGYSGLLIEIRKPNGELLSKHKIYDKEDLVLLDNIAEKGIDVLGVGLTDHFPEEGSGDPMNDIDDLMFWLRMWIEYSLNGIKETEED